MWTDFITEQSCHSEDDYKEAALSMLESLQKDAHRILQLLQEDDMKVYSRMTGYQTRDQLKQYCVCVLKRIQGDYTPQKADLEFDEYVVKKLTLKLKSIRVTFTSSTSSGYAEEVEKMKLATRLINRLNATPEDRCAHYFSEIKEAVKSHKMALMAFADTATKALDLNDEESKQLVVNLRAHDWSKLCMPAYFAGSLFDKDLGSTLADFKNQQDPMLKGFFDCVVLHNLLEGSTAVGHHAAAALVGNSASSVELKSILENGKPDKLHVLESILDTVDVLESILDSDSEANSWLAFQFEKLAPDCEQEICEQLFIRRFQIMLGNGNLTTIKGCRDACTNALGALWNTTEFKEHSKLTKALLDGV